MAQRVGISKTRSRIDKYVTAGVIFVSSAVFLNVVPFVPAGPFLPLLVAVALGFLSLRESGAASAALYLLAFFSILWQLIGFGFFQLLSTGVGLAVLLLMALPAMTFISRSVDATALPFALLAVGLMITPAYSLSVPLVVVAAIFFNLATAAALSISFVLFLAPFLLIENGLYLASVGPQGFFPVVFAPLSLLEGTLRPPLPNLNIFVSEFPAGYLYSGAAGVVRFISDDSSLLAIPLIVFFVVLLGSSTLLMLLRPLMENFRLLEDEKRWRLTVRLAASVIAPAIAVILLAILSLPGAGGFRTSIEQSWAVPASVLGFGVVVGGSFVGLDTVTTRLEAGELSSARLQQMLVSVKSELASSKQLLDRVATLVPSMNLVSERKTLSESESYVKDIEMQLATATEDASAAWIDRFKKVVYPAVLEMQDRVRKEVIAEVSYLSSVAVTANNNLREARVEPAYQTVEGVGQESSLEDSLRAYEAAVSSISKTTLELFDQFVSTTDAFYRLMRQESVPPAVSPVPLLRSHDYATAMRLVAGEYWLDFHVKRAEEFAGKVGELRELLLELESGLDEGNKKQLATILGSRIPDLPSKAQTVLQGLAELSALLEDVLQTSVAEAKAIRELISSIDPTAVSIIRLEATEVSATLEGLGRELTTLGLSLDEMVGFLKSAVPALRLRVEAVLRDRASLIVLSQYPVAARVIDSRLERRKSMKIGLLPFQPKASALYCKLYAAANPSLEYDEIKEVLSVRDA